MTKLSFKLGLLCIVSQPMLLAQPSLAVVSTLPSSIALSWGAEFGNFRLETATTLFTPDWAPFDGIIVKNASILTVNVPLRDGIQFFRLIARAETNELQSALHYLTNKQLESGAWQDAPTTAIRDTSQVLTTLLRIDKTNAAINRGVAFLLARNATNNDDAARKGEALVCAGYPINEIITYLLDSQADELSDQFLAFPGKGWGLAKGFESSVLDTALVLRALRAGGFQAGFAVIRELVSDNPSPFQPFAIPEGASDVRVAVYPQPGYSQEVTLRFPSGGLASAIVRETHAINYIPLPAKPGNWEVSVRIIGATKPIRTSMEVSYVRNNFNYKNVIRPLAFLGLSQNDDGGWGITPHEPSQLMVTCQVLTTLAGWRSEFHPDELLISGVRYLLTHQNNDGGFSHEENRSNIVETALSVLAITSVDATNDVADAVRFLKNRQELDGSWNGGIFETALVAEALGNYR